MHTPPLELEYKTAFGSTMLDAVEVLEMKTALGAVIETHTEHDGDEGVVEAYVAVTGTRDEVGDVIEHGAFDRTLKTLRPKMCLGHDWNRPIGEPVEIRMLLPGDPNLPTETADGQPWPAEAGALYTKNRYMLTTKDGRDAYEHAKFFKGRTAYSIGYVVKRKRHGLHNGLKTRFIQDLDLYEYGPVLHGAHPLAHQRSIKSGEPDGIEHKVRKVKDAHYWGYPVGTPITATMRPKGPTARKLRKEGKVPDRQQGTTDAVTAAGKPAPARTTPGKATADADASGLFPEPQSEARVRARNPKGKDEEHTGLVSDVLADDELSSADMQVAFEGLLDEGITAAELDEDLRNRPRPDDIDEGDWSDRIDEAVSAYRTSYKRENRRQQSVDAGNAGGGDDRLPRNPKARPADIVDDLVLQTNHGRPEHRDKLIEKAHQKLIDNGVHPDEVDVELAKQRNDVPGGSTPEQHQGQLDAIAAEHRRRYEAALAEQGGGKGEPDGGANAPEGDTAASTEDTGQPGPPPLPEGDDDGRAPAAAEGDGATPAPRKFDRTEVPGAREGAADPNPEHVTNTPPPKVRKGSKLHVAISPQTGEKFYRASPRPYTHATLVTDEKTGAQSAWSFSESANGALNQAKEFRRRGQRGRIHVVELDADHDGSPDSPELDPNAPGNADAITRSEGTPEAPEAPAEPDPTTAAMWKADPARAGSRLPEAARGEYDGLTPEQQAAYARARSTGEDHAAALDSANAAPDTGADNAPDAGVDNSGTETGETAAPPLPPGDEEADTSADNAPDAGAAEELPEPPAQLDPQEQAWADDPAAAADGQLDEEQRAEYDALDEQGKHSYATARISGENHDDALAYAQHRSQATAPADAGDANAPEGAAPETPPAPGELRPTGAEATPDNLANTIATYGAKVDLSGYDTDMLKATDAEFDRRAGLLGKPGAVTANHQLLKDEIARREAGGGDAGAPGTPSELPASPNLGVQPGAEDATGNAPSLGEDTPDVSNRAIPGGDVTEPGDVVKTPGQQGESQGQEATRELAPERTAQITADEIAEANATADASFGVEEADDGVFEVDQDVADRQERVAALLDAEAAGNFSLADETDDGLRSTRSDVVSELKLQDHLTARERNAAAPTRAQRSGTGASGGDGSGDPEAEPAVDPGPKVRPGVAGALEDFADAIESDDPDELLRTRARLESSLKRSRSDSEVVAAIRAVIESTEMPDPALLRAAAERLRAEARERRNSQARARRAARRFERDRLRSLLGSIDAEMRRRNLPYDPVPGLDGDADTTAPAAGGPAPGTWTTRRRPLGGQADAVEGANYDGIVEWSGSRNLHRYQWTVHNQDGEVLASGSGTTDDPEVARTAVAQALAAQQTLGRIPSDAVLPQPGGGDNTAARREIERSGVDAITARIDDSSVNPITGLPSPLAPPAGLTTPPVKVFDSPQAVRAHLDANTVHPITGTPNAAGNVRWDDVKLSPGGGLAVGTMQDGSPTLFHAASGRSISPYGAGGQIEMSKADLMNFATYLESMTDVDGKRVDFGEPDNRKVAEAALSWKSPADGSNLVQAATRAVVADKIREGKWTDKVVRTARLKPVAGDGTNPSRRSLIDDLRRSYGELAKVQGRSRMTPEDKKTEAMVRGAGLLADAGAPDGSAVLLRRRAAELRDLADAADRTANAAPDNVKLRADAAALRRSADHADVLENLADAYLSLHSPAPSPGTRLARVQPGERLAFRDGDGVRTYRVLTPMRPEGDQSRADATSTAQVIDESTGQQLTVAIQNSANARPLVRVYDPSDKYGSYVGSRHATSLGGDGFVVLDLDQPTPEPDGFRDAALADVAAIPSAALNRAAEDLPESPVERTARRAAAPEGGRAPARRSAAAPRRAAPEPTRTPASSDEQKLAQAQIDGMGEFLGAPFELSDTAAPGGFKNLDEVAKAADAAAAAFPAGGDPRAKSSLQAIGTNGYGEADNPNHASGGAKLSPGGHLIVRKDSIIVHARSGQMIWSPNSPWSPTGTNIEDPSPVQVMRIADYLERGRVDGQAIPWETNDTDKLKEAFRAVMERNNVNPLTTMTHSAVADHMAGVSRPTANDVTNMDRLTSGVDIAARLPNPDVFDAQMSRGVTENSYIALSGKRVPVNNTLTGETAGAGELPGSSDTKEGQNLARRVFMEFALSRAQAKVAPLDSARRLDAVANELDGRIITTADGKKFTPSDDLRARSKAIRDAYDNENPSPLGQLARANFDGVLAVDWGKAEVGVGQVFGPGWGGSRGAEQGTRNVRLAKLKTELREGGTVKIGKSEAGNLKATLAGRTIEDSIDGGTVKIGPDGAVTVSWQEDLYGGAASPGIRLPSGSWKLDQQASTGPGSLTDAEYEEHTAEIESKLAAAFSDGQATDVVHTIGHDGQSWTPERAKLHNEIIDEMWQAGGAAAPTEGRAVIAGGLGGAGKSTVLKGYAGVDATQYFTINPDDVKEAMAARDMIPAVEGLSPMEASPLVHEESSYIANLLAKRAYQNRTNVVWDVTLARKASALLRVNELRRQGYGQVDGVFVDIPVETSVERAMARHRNGMQKLAAGEGYGGRYVPPSVIRSHLTESGSSTNREAFDSMETDFDSWVIYDNSVSGREPQKVAGTGTWA